jgi:hypothetical protein
LASALLRDRLRIVVINGNHRGIAQTEESRLPGELSEALECLRDLVPGIDGDYLRHWPIAVSERPGSALESQPSDQLEGSFSDHSPEHLMEMERREARHGRERLQVERFIEIAGDARLRAGWLGRKRMASPASLKPLYAWQVAAHLIWLADLGRPENR